MNSLLNEKIDEFLKENKQNIIDDIITLVNIESVSVEGDSTHPFGEGPAKALDKFLEIGENMGFKSKNYDYYCGALKFGDFEKEIGIFGHMDVVPAGNGWTYEPYNAVEENGFIIGRGTSDDKGPTVAGLYAMKFLKDMNVPVKYGVQLVAGCNEERGMGDITKFLETEKTPVFSFTPDSEFPVCIGEKGNIRATLVFPKLEGKIKDLFGGIVSNMVADRATAVIADTDAVKLNLGDKFIVEQDGADVKITACGIASHAAHPEGSLNAIYMLAKAIAENSLCDEADVQWFEKIVEILSDYNGVGIGTAINDEVSGKITHISGLVKLVDHKPQLDINVRYPVTANSKEVLASIENHAKNLGIELVIGSHNEPCYVPADTPAIKALIESYQQVSGDDLETYTMGGGTYSKHVPNCVAYGPKFQNEVLPFTDGRGHEHMADECMSVESLLKAVKIYILALVKLNEIEF